MGQLLLFRNFFIELKAIFVCFIIYVILLMKYLYFLGGCSRINMLL